MNRLKVTHAKAPTMLGIPSCSAFVFGMPSDERGEAAIKYGNTIAKQEYSLVYSSEKLTYELNGKVYNVDDLGPLIALFDGGLVVCDATTLGFVETFMCLRAWREAKSGEMVFVYVEPENYENERERSSGVLHKRDFSLSKRAQQFSAVPGAVVLLTPQRRARAAVLVGYEGDRLQQFLEENAIAGEGCSVVYGVPAFNAGWESNAFANSVGQLYERRISSILYAGAINPLSAYDSIKEVHDSVSNDSAFLIVPVGTKPHGLGAALYACDHPEVGLVYDNPEKRKGRTRGVGVWNLYRLSLAQ